MLRSELARAATEAQVMSASTLSAITESSATKERKRELELDGTVVTKKPQTNGMYAQQIVLTKSWPSGSAATEDASKGLPSCDHKEGHYIILPDDMIYKCYRTVRLLGQ